MYTMNVPFTGWQQIVAQNKITGDVVYETGLEPTTTETDSNYVKLISSNLPIMKSAFSRQKAIGALSTKDVQAAKDGYVTISSKNHYLKMSPDGDELAIRKPVACVDDIVISKNVYLGREDVSKANSLNLFSSLGNFGFNEIKTTLRDTLQLFN